MESHGNEMRLSESHGNEGTSSNRNVQMKGPKLKRKRGDNNCHQCHRNDKGRVVHCTKCKKKSYCIPCITKWYLRMEETDFVEACPGCRNVCNCLACLHSNKAKKDLPILDIKLGTPDMIRHSKYILGAIVPFLRQFVFEQKLEREEEARIQGSSIAELRLSNPSYTHNDLLQCNNCKTEIYDIHRSCENCLYKLCITCCREIRDVFPNNKGSENLLSAWKMSEKGIIVCPSEITGGCGRGNLDLKSIYSDNWISQLLTKAQKLVAEAGLGKLDEIGGCSYLRNDDLGEESTSKKICKEASNDNYLHFHRHLYNGEPLIVPNVLGGMSGLSWEPLVMWRACRRSRKTSNYSVQDLTVLNCLNWCKEKINMAKFFRGYSEGLFDSEGRLKILALEEWPSAESFKQRLPRHFLEFIRCLPFRQYTDPQGGFLNIAAKVPNMLLKEDMGPKMWINYGVNEELGFQSLANLQYAQSDRVSIIMHAAAIGLNNGWLSTTDKKAKKNQHGENEKQDKGKRKNNPSSSSNTVHQFEDGEVCAEWDIFRRQDVPKLEEYLRKHFWELRHIFPLQQLAHPIHEKAFYLTKKHKRNLKQEYGIEAWPFVQRLGDAVFIPAGCPHQIRYLKSCTSVVVNFVSPESVGECLRLSKEYRSLPHNHRCKEDKLQVKKMTLHAISQAVQYLDKINSNTIRIPIEAPGQRLDHAFMRRELEVMKLIVKQQGHLCDPDKIANLEKGIPTLLNQLVSTGGSSSSSQQQHGNQS